MFIKTCNYCKKRKTIGDSRSGLTDRNFILELTLTLIFNWPQPSTGTDLNANSKMADYYSEYYSKRKWPLIYESDDFGHTTVILIQNNGHFDTK